MNVTFGDRTPHLTRTVNDAMSGIRDCSQKTEGPVHTPGGRAQLDQAVYKQLRLLTTAVEILAENQGAKFNKMA